MNRYIQGDDFAICKKTTPEIESLNDYDIHVSIFTHGFPPIIEASTTPTEGELSIHTRCKLGWFINIPSIVSSRLFPEVYNIQVTYKNIPTESERTYIHSSVFSIKNKIY